MAALLVLFGSGAAAGSALSAGSPSAAPTPPGPASAAGFFAVALLGAAGAACELSVLVTDLDFGGSASAAGSGFGASRGAARGSLGGRLVGGLGALGATGGLAVFFALLLAGPLLAGLVRATGAAGGSVVGSVLICHDEDSLVGLARRLFGPACPNGVRGRGGGW